MRNDAGARRAGAPGRVTAGAESDRIWNGADDDGSGTVAVGSDRISTELHEVNRAANAGLPKPLSLDSEFNDPADLEHRKSAKMLSGLE